MNNEGKTEPVFIFSAINECLTTLRVFFCEFIKLNDTAKTLLGVTDKDMKERSILKEFFPNIKLRLCIFHVIQTFNREIGTRCRNLTKKRRLGEKKKIIQLLKSSSDEIYQYNLNKLHPLIYSYYMKNWNELKSEVIEYYYENVVDMGSTTNNRSEGINSFIKNHFKRKYEFSTFFTELKSLLEQLRAETHSKYLKKYMSERSSRVPYSCPTVEICDQKYTLYASRLIKTYTCEEFHNIDNCLLYKRYGLVCQHCIENSGATFDIIDQKQGNFWKRSTYVDCIKFPVSEITRNDYTTHINTKLNNSIPTRNDTMNTYNQKNYAKVLSMDMSYLCKAEKNLETNLNKENEDTMIKRTPRNKRNEFNYIWILTKQLGYQIKDIQGVDHCTKEKFLKQIIKKIDDIGLDELLKCLDN